PFVRVGDERNAFGLEDLVGRASIKRLDIPFGVRNQELSVGKFRVKTRGKQPVVILLVRPVDLPIERAVPLEEEAGRVSKRSRGFDARHPFFERPRPSSRRKDTRDERHTYAPLSRPAINIWKRRLPVPGSR